MAIVSGQFFKWLHRKGGILHDASLTIMFITALCARITGFGYIALFGHFLCGVFVFVEFFKKRKIVKPQIAFNVFLFWLFPILFYI